jgi:hypothetical protein
LLGRGLASCSDSLVDADEVEDGVCGHGLFTSALY